MDDDWDLHAVVRGCAAALSSTRSTTPTTDNNPPPTFPPNSPFPSLTLDADPFQGLEEIYQELTAHPPPPPPPTTAAPVYQPHQEMAQIAPPFQMNMQRFPAAIRPRRRKNQQTKLVRQMTQEELSADSWAWRKYGQKPIKGSPYPRNYYRCSTSKGCAARKQVERSPDDAGIFVVSYTGEHTHARPTHRSSLSGSTRNKLVSRNNDALLLNRGTASSALPSASSLSPSTPSMGGDAPEMAEEEEAGGSDNRLPNDMMNDDDDMFRGFQDSDHSSGGGGDLFSGGLLSSPPWSPGSATTYSGGGGC